MTTEAATSIRLVADGSAFIGPMLLSVEMLNRFRTTADDAGVSAGNAGKAIRQMAADGKGAAADLTFLANTLALATTHTASLMAAGQQAQERINFSGVANGLRTAMGELVRYNAEVEKAKQKELAGAPAQAASGGAGAAAAAVDRLAEAHKKSSEHAEKAAKAHEAFKQALAGVQEMAGNAAAALIALTDQYSEIKNRLLIVAGDQRSVATAMADTFAVAQATETGWAETNDLYVRLAQSAKGLAFTQGELAAITKTVAQAVSFSGLKGAEASAAMRLFGDMMREGRLGATEFNLLLRQSPAIVDTLARGLDTNIETLRHWAQTGVLTTEKVLQGLQRAAPAMQEAYDRRVTPMEESVTKIRNAVVRLAGQFDDMTGIVSMGAGLLSKLADNLGLVAAVAGTLAAAAMPAAIALIGGPLVTALGAATGGAIAFAGAMAVNPLTWVVGAVAGAVAAFTYFKDEVVTLGKTEATVAEWLSATWQTAASVVAEAFRSDVETITDFLTAVSNRVGETVDAMVGAFKSTGAALADLWQAAGELPGRLVQVVQDGLQVLAGWVQALWGQVSSAISGLPQQVQALLGDLLAWVEGRFSEAVGTVSRLWSELGTVWSEVFEPLRDGAVQVWGALVEAATQAVDLLKDAWQGAAEALPAQMKEQIDGALSWVEERFGEAAAQAGRLWSELGDGLAAAFVPLRDAALQVWNAIVDAANGAIDLLKNAWQEAVGFIAEQLQAVIDGALSWLEERFNEAVVEVSRLWSEFGDALAEVFAPLREAAAQAWSAVVETADGAAGALKKAWQGAADFFGGLKWGTVGATIINILNRVIGGIVALRDISVIVLGAVQDAFRTTFLNVANLVPAFGKSLAAALRGDFGFDALRAQLAKIGTDLKSEVSDVGREISAAWARASSTQYLNNLGAAIDGVASRTAALASGMHGAERETRRFNEQAANSNGRQRLPADLQAMVDALQKSKPQLQKQVNELVSQYQGGTLPADQFRQALEKLQKTVQHGAGVHQAAAKAQVDYSAEIAKGAGPARELSSAVEVMREALENDQRERAQRVADFQTEVAGLRDGSLAYEEQREQIVARSLAQLEAAKAAKVAQGASELEIAAIEYEISALKQLADEYKKKRAAKEDGQDGNSGDKGAKGAKGKGPDPEATEEAWKKTAETINSSLTDAIFKSFRSGESFAKNFRQLLKDQFDSLVLRPVIQAIVAPVGNAISQLFTSVGNGITGTLQGANGGPGGGFPLNNLSSLFNGNSVGLGFERAGSFVTDLFGFGNTALGPTQSGGNIHGLFANASSVPNWQYGLAGLAGGVFGGQAVNWLGGGERGQQIGSTAGGIGATVGMAAGASAASFAQLGAMAGPIGALIGAVIGAAVGYFSDPDGLAQRSAHLVSNAPRSNQGYGAESRFGTFGIHDDKWFSDAEMGEGIRALMGSFKTLDDAIARFLPQSEVEAIKERLKGLNDRVYGFGTEHGDFSSGLAEMTRDRYALVFESIDPKIAALIKGFQGKAEDLVQSVTLLANIDFSKIPESLRNQLASMKTLDPKLIAGMVEASAVVEQVVERFGRMPQVLQQQYEQLFKDGKVDPAALASFKELALLIPQLLDYSGLLNKGLTSLSYEGFADLVKALGGAQNATASIGAYMQNYFSESERFGLAQAELTRSFNELGLRVPASKEAFRDLVGTLDVTTEEGKKLFAALMRLAPAYAQFADAVNKAGQTKDQLIERYAPKSLNERLQQFGARFRDLNQKIPETAAEFAALAASADPATASGRQLIELLAEFAPTFDAVAAAAAQATADLMNAMSSLSSSWGAAFEQSEYESLVNQFAAMRNDSSLRGAKPQDWQNWINTLNGKIPENLSTDERALLARILRSAGRQMQGPRDTSNAVNHYNQAVQETGQAADDAAERLKALIAQLKEERASLVDKYSTEDERLAAAKTKLVLGFASLGVAVPKTAADFKTLLEGIDLNSEAGRKLFDTLKELAPSFDTVTAAAEQAHQRLVESALNETRRLADEIRQIDQFRGGLRDAIFGIRSQMADFKPVEHWSSQVATLRSQMNASTSTTDRLQYAGRLQNAIQQRYQAESGALRQAHEERLRAIQNEQQAAQRVAQEQQQAAEKLYQALRGLGEFAKGLLTSELSPLTNRQRLDETQRQFRATLAAARGGDADAAGRLQGLAQGYLQQARGYYASSSDYSAIFGEVQGGLAELGAGAVAPDLTPFESQSLEFQRRQREEDDRFNREMLDIQRNAIRELEGLNSTAGDWQETLSDALETQVKALGDLKVPLDQINTAIGTLPEAIGKKIAEVVAQIEATRQAERDQDKDKTPRRRDTDGDLPPLPRTDGPIIVSLDPESSHHLAAGIVLQLHATARA